MFSDLTRGVGCWNGDLKLEKWQDENERPQPSVLPTLPQDQAHHRHGVTVSPRLSAHPHSQPITSDHDQQSNQGNTEGKLVMPKTFLTRKGALVLFSAPDQSKSMSERDQRYMRKARKLLKHRYGDQISKLGKLSRLAESILIFGDENERPEDASISDPDNKMVLKFLHDLDNKHGDQRSKPGSAPNVYLRDLKSRASSAKSRASGWSDGEQTHQSESRCDTSIDTNYLTAEPEALSARFMRSLSPGSTIHPHEDNTRASTSCSGRTYKVLSAEKLTASLKSGGYLGRSTPGATMPQGLPLTPPGSRRSSVGSMTSQYQKLLTGRSQSRQSPDKMAITLGKDGQYHPHPLHVEVDGFVQRNSTPIDPQSLAPEDSLENGSRVNTPDVNIHNIVQSNTDSVKSDKLPLGGGKVHAPPPSHRPEVLSSTDNLDNKSEVNLTPEIHHDLDIGLNTTAWLDSEMNDQADTEDAQGHLPAAGDEFSEEDITLEDGEELQLDSSTMGAQPLLPHYSALVTMGPTDESFSMERTHPADTPTGGFLAGHMTTDLNSSGHSLQRALVSLQKDDPDTDETTQEGMTEATPQGVTSIQVTSRSGSVASSHSGMASDRPRSAARPRKQSAEEEILEDAQKYPAAPPSTRSTSPSHDPLRQLEGDTGLTDRAAALAGAEDLLQDDSEWETLKTESEKAQTEARRRSFELEKEDIKGTQEVGKDGEAADAGAMIETAEVSKSSDLTETEKEVDKAASVSGIPKQETKVDSSSTEDSAPNVQHPDTDGKAEDTLFADTSKIVANKDSKESVKVSDVAKVKDIKPEPAKVKETEKSHPKKEYTKSIDVSQMKTPDKKPVLKKEPSVKAPVTTSVSKVITKPTTSPTRNLSKPRDVKALKEPRTPSGRLYQPDPPPQKSEEEKALEQLEKEVKNMVTEGLPQDVELTAEEMEIERQLLKERLEAAEKKIQGELSSPPGKRAAQKKPQVQKKGPKGRDPKKASQEEQRVQQREALREAKRLEKQKRLDEAKQLEEQIREKEATQEHETDEAMKKQQMLQDEIEMMKREAMEARILEEQAQEQMAAERRAAREEREIRRKADLERKKQEAMKRREHEKKIAEEGRRKEREMLRSISNAEQRQMMEEEERRKHEEQERLEQEREEEEEKELEKQMEDDEENLRELERQAEEEALAFLVREREEAEERQRALQREAAEEEEALERKRKQIEEEQEHLQAELQKHAEEERLRQEEEMQRFNELRRIEEEAMERMRKDLDGRRQVALRRREQNLERRGNLSKLNHGQGMTRPWTFTYYVDWPRNTYEKRMGQDPKKKGFRMRKPKPKPST